MSNLMSYVVARDFREWGRDLVQRFRGELLQWRKNDELSATALMIAALLSIFRGMRKGLEGAAVQMDAEGWAELLGVSSRMVLKAFAQLEAAGWARRRRRLIKHAWEDTVRDVVIQRQRADVHACAYLQPLGAVRVLRRGQRAGDLVKKLRAEHAGKIRVIAKRITDAPTKFRPFPGREEKRFERTASVRARGRAGSFHEAPGTEPPASSTSPPKSEAWGRYGGGRFVAERERLRALRALTPAQAWRELWFGGDDVQRRWLIREWEAFRGELESWFERTATPAQRAEQSRRRAADVEQLQRLERLQPSQRERAVHQVLYAQRWSGRAWVPAPAYALAELRKEQAALRAAGELPRKTRVRRPNSPPERRTQA